MAQEKPVVIINLSHDPMCDDGILLLKGNDILRIQYNIGIDQYETAGGYRGLHIDHIVPVSKGGKTVPSNLQVLCSKCNGNKSNKL